MQFSFYGKGYFKSIHLHSEMIVGVFGHHLVVSFLTIVVNCHSSLDNKSHGRASVASDPRAAPESDTDSMAEYGEGDTGE